MQQLLTGEKKALQASEVRAINIPYFPEISVTKLIEKSKADERILKHLPDESEKKRPNKEFVWHVVAHFQRDFINNSITTAMKLRASRLAADEKRKAKLVVDPAMLKRLSGLNMIRSKSIPEFHISFLCRGPCVVAQLSDA